MRKSRFTESEIVSILKQGKAGVPIAEILRQHNICGIGSWGGQRPSMGD